MSFSCVDFTDEVLSALEVEVPEQNLDDPAGQCALALAEIKRLQDLEAARQLADDNGGIWGEHPLHKVADWQLEVANGDTRAGYWDWVISELESRSNS